MAPICSWITRIVLLMCFVSSVIYARHVSKLFGVFMAWIKNGRIHEIKLDAQILTRNDGFAGVLGW